MAGDWIPITLDLSRRREVLIMAEITGACRHTIVGMLTEFWGWASGETEDGVICRASVATLSPAFASNCSFDVFCKAMIEVGWLTENNGSITITNWERWLSNSAKARLGNSLRQKLLRSRKKEDVATNVATNARPQDSTVQRRLKTSLRTVDGNEKDGGGDGGALEMAPAPQTGRTEADGKEIDWGEVTRTANRFARLGLNKTPQDVSLVRKLATMNAQRRIPVDWIESFVETMHGPAKKNKPGAYLMGMCKKRAKAAGLDFRRLLAETPEPPAKGKP